MVTKRCCCVADCLAAEDDFNRADSDDPGTLWTEVTGDSDIDGNALLVNSGITVTSARQAAPVLPGTKYTTSCTVTLDRDSGTYSEWHLISNFQDANNFSFIKITYNSGDSTWRPQFYDRAGGSDTLVMDITTHPQSTYFSSDVDGNLAVQWCYGESEWSLSDVKSQNNWTTCDSNPVSTLPTNTSHGLVGFKDAGKYDDFMYYIHWESQRTCSPCQCFCVVSNTDWSCLPETLTLTLVPTGGPYSGGLSPCPSPSNLVFTMYQVVPIMGATEPDAPTLTPNRETADKRVWHSPLITGDTGSANINGRFHRMTLVCDSGQDRLYLVIQQNPNNDPFLVVNPGPDNTTLYFNPADTGASGNRTTKFFDLDRSTCDPLSLVFEDIQVNLGVSCNPYSAAYEAVITP